MLKLWERLKGSARLPDLSRVQGQDLERIRDKLMLLDVVWHDDEPRYLIRFQGADFTKMHNRDCTGLFLDDIITACGPREWPARVPDGGGPWYSRVHVHAGARR